MYCPGSKPGRSPKWAPPGSDVRGDQEVSIPDESSSDLGRHTQPQPHQLQMRMCIMTQRLRSSQTQFPAEAAKVQARELVMAKWYKPGAGSWNKHRVLTLAGCHVPQDSEQFPKARSLLFHSITKNRLAQAMIRCETQGWEHQLCVRMVTKPWPAPQLGLELPSKLLAGHITVSHFKQVTNPRAKQIRTQINVRNRHSQNSKLENFSSDFKDQSQQG